TGQFVAVSPAAYSVLGYEPSELIAKNKTVLLRPENADRVSKMLATARSEGTKQSFETPVLHKDGRVVDILWSVRYSETERSLFCIMHDMTERKEIERLKQEFVR